MGVGRGAIMCSSSGCGYDSVVEARSSLGGYLAFYNRKRPHSSLDGRTPDQVYFGGLATAEAA